MARTRNKETGGHVEGDNRANGQTTPRGAETRQRILDAAIALFQEHGYKRTTLRAIATRAGVPLGNSYHYFTTKQELLAALAQQLHEEYLQYLLTCRPVLDQHMDVGNRLRGVIDAYWSTLDRYQPIAFEMQALGGDPRSPLNSFGAQAAGRHQAEIALFAEVIRGARTTIHPEIAEVLPTLLWLYFQGMQRIWLHDPTANHERTRQVTDVSVELVVRLIQVAREQMLDRVRKKLLEVCRLFLVVPVRRTPPTQTRGDEEQR